MWWQVADRVCWLSTAASFCPSSAKYQRPVGKGAAEIVVTQATGWRGHWLKCHGLVAKLRHRARLGRGHASTAR